MNSGQNHFPDPVFNKPPDLPYDFTLRPAANAAAGKGDDAVAAELVASVLDLDIGTGMPGTGQMHILKGRRAGEILPESRLCLPLLLGLLLIFSPFKKICQDLSDLRLFVVSDDQVDRIVRVHPRRICLHITADRNDNCIRILLFGLVEHLAALSVRNICHGAGVHHINVRLFLKRHLLETLIPQDLAHNIQFVAVDLTAKIVKSNSILQISDLLRIVFLFTQNPQRSAKGPCILSLTFISADFILTYRKNTSEISALHRKGKGINYENCNNFPQFYRQGQILCE